MDGISTIPDQGHSFLFRHNVNYSILKADALSGFPGSLPGGILPQDESYFNFTHVQFR